MQLHYEARGQWDLVHKDPSSKATGLRGDALKKRQKQLGKGKWDFLYMITDDMIPPIGHPKSAYLMLKEIEMMFLGNGEE